MGGGGGLRACMRAFVYALRIAFTDKIMRFINTIIINTRNAYYR